MGRSLSIVSVQQENAGATPSYCLVIPHQPKWPYQTESKAVTDAVNMGREVCAVYPGFAMPLDSQGACLVFSQNTALAACKPYTQRFCCKRFCWSTRPWASFVVAAPHALATQQR
ncbi:MAG: hypothetical protein CM15mP120_06250 [Pseudomonadota bacterium]|nr:MAG: hypothetical protein CM15mP120_06250 [Pseudomonadota bacterium]